MILVVGGTGLVGHEVCQRLVRRGEAVRAFERATSSPEKVEALRSSGVELCVGDLKDLQSIVAACRDVNAVISTASSTLTRQPGDSIQSVDATGQLNLVNAAKDANVSRFVFVSFRKTPDISFPLSDAKAQVENAISGLNFTVIQASWFMEVWLSPALGFDYANAAARIYGSGVSPISWVTEASLTLKHPQTVPAAQRRSCAFHRPRAGGRRSRRVRDASLPSARGSSGESMARETCPAILDRMRNFRKGLGI